jgi:hypothetical protein
LANIFMKTAQKMKETDGRPKKDEIKPGGNLPPVSKTRDIYAKIIGEGKFPFCISPLYQTPPRWCPSAPTTAVVDFSPITAVMGLSPISPR